MVFTAATGLAGGALPFGIIRFFFGVGEAAAFPAASRAILPWLPRASRAFGQGFQHAGSRLGAAATPLFFVFLIGAYGWRQAFFVLGIMGIVLAIIWAVYFRNKPEQHPGVNKEELVLLGVTQTPASTATPKPPVPWL